MKNLYLTFPKKLRLLTNKDFFLVFKNSYKIKISEIVIFSHFNIFNYPRIGLIFSKKYVKKSHDRNRIKRIIRESFRINQYKLPNIDFVIIGKKNILSVNNITLFKVLQKSWHHYSLLCH